jgi:signal transduction histidine kinase
VGAVCIEVCDTGPGIAADLLETLFDPFVRGDEGGDGMGLGLAIARDLMEAMDGTIRVESELGTGTCFRLLVQRA